MKKHFFCYAAILIIFFLDRFIKLFCRAKLGFSFFKNFNLAFSLPFPNGILIILIVIIILILFFLLIRSYQKNNFYQIFSLLLIISGAVSNLIDRLIYGYVIDYINIGFFTVFNLADTMIVGGIIFYVIQNIFLRPQWPGGGKSGNRNRN